MKKKLGEYFGASHKRIRDFVVHQMLHVDDPPHRLALGLGIGMFITFTPTIGFQMGLVFALCWLLGANKVVGVPVVWISNPATIVPVYYPCLWLGEFLLGKEHRNFAWFQTMFTGAPVEWLPKVKFYGVALKDIAIELWLGCIVIGGILGLLFYLLTYWMIYSYRMRVWGQLVPPSYTAEHSLTEPDQSDDASTHDAMKQP
jgi:uncharacterized protein